MTELLVSLAIIFVVGGAFILIANQFDLPTVPFLIIGGLVAGLFIDDEITLEFARYGIALLVFSFGVSIRFEGIRTVLRDSEFVAVAQIAVTGSLGFIAAVLLNTPVEQAVYVGVAAALSSTIVGTGMIKADIRDNLIHGRVANSVHFIQDVLAIVILLVLSAEAFAPDPVAASIGYGVALLVAGVIVNQYIFDVIGRLAKGSDELLIVSIITILVIFIGAAEFIGVSIAVGAFAAGIAVRHEPVEHIGVFNGLASIETFFVTVFFVTVGALVSVPSVDVIAIAATLIVLTAVVKPAITVVLLMYKGYESRSSTLVGLNLDQVSEFALIIVIEAMALGFVAYPVPDAIILAAAVTMITSSLSRRYDERIHRTLADRGFLWEQHTKVDEGSHVPDGIEDHVVIVGYGRQGQRLAETCKTVDIPFVVVENDPTLLETVELECDAYVFGDSMEKYTLEKARADEASLVVSTAAQRPVSERILELVDGDVILRAEDRETATELLEKGALYVAVSGVLAADVLIEHVQGVVDDESYVDEIREHGREQTEKLLREEHGGKSLRKDVDADS